MFGKKDEMEIAMELLKGDGLSRIAFTKGVLNKENVNNKDKESCRESFDNVIEKINAEYGKDIYKDGHAYLLKEANVDDLKKEIAELKDENSTLRGKIAELSGVVKGSSPERKQWLYMKGKGQMFNISEVESKLKEGWKDHPKG